MEPKSETKVVYDDRRKVLIQTFKQEQEIKENEKVVGHSVINREATFDEQGIRETLKTLSNQRAKCEQVIKSLKENLKDVEFTSELKELEEKLQIINNFNKAKKAKSQLEEQESNLKMVKKDIRDIKEAIGTRLKL